MSEFKVGDRVTIVKGSRYDGSNPQNPPHGNVGVVTEVSGRVFKYRVKWGDTNSNGYTPGDLELVGSEIPTEESIMKAIETLNLCRKLDGSFTILRANTGYYVDYNGCSRGSPLTRVKSFIEKCKEDPRKKAMEDELNKLKESVRKLEEQIKEV
jgi:hypothetical protein